MKTIKLILISFISALIGGGLFSVIGYIVSIWMVPNKTPEGNVEMPIPQMFSAFIIGIIGLIITFIFTYVKLKKTKD